MPLLLPNLDDRTWSDLSDEGRALIPVYGPEWTDHNASDPGITLVELLAWITEMDIYQLNQISDRERLKFLALVGVAPRPSRPAQVVLSFALSAGTPGITLPAGAEFAEPGPLATAIRYRTLYPTALAQGSLDALQFRSPAGFQNLTPAWRRRTVLYPFGTAPEPGMEFYLGFSQPLPIGVPVSLFFTFGDGHSGAEDRCRLLHEAEALEEHCQPPAANPCAKKTNSDVTAPSPETEDLKNVLRHYGVRTVWKFQALVNGKAQWLPLDSTTNEVQDDTRAFTLDGTVTVQVPQTMSKSKVGAVSTPLYYLCCRFEAGRYDADPVLQDVAFNGIRTEQAVPAGMSFVIDPGATIHPPGSSPKPNQRTTLRMELDARKNVTSLTFGGGSAHDPQFLILDYRAPSAGAAGSLNIEAVFLGFGNGFPNQQVSLPNAPAQQSSVDLYTLEDATWYQWKLRGDFDASTCKDFDAVLDPASGTITFGDGEKGRVPPEIRASGGKLPEKCLIFATYRATQAQAGNLAALTITQLADSPHNHALLADGWTLLKSQLISITNRLAAGGGAAAETIDLAAGRADTLVAGSQRAVTLVDYEELARTTPGTRIARVTARANLHPSFPCFNAPGMITVIVLPYLPKGQPVPTPGLLHAVSAHLRRHRIIGTRVEVVGPTYIDVTVQATVQSKSGTNKSNLQQAIVTALNRFLDPLIGGPDGDGWPFGRDVYRSEIMKVMDAVSGADHIVSMDLIAGSCQPQCGNVCLGPTWLVAAGAHAITIL